jgi:hypothetical protein
MKHIVIRMRHRAAAAAIIGLALAPSPARADACKCRHLEAVGVALHNTICLREAYRRKSNELRPLDASSARTELDRFVQSLPKGMPITIPANAVLETDGWSVMVDYGLSGTVPSFGISCRLPGGGAGAGMSIPSPIPPASSPAKAEVRLQNGAQELKTLAESEAARIPAQGGIGLTGSTSVQLNYDCPPGD